MAITNYYCLCVREILHLLSSQLIIDFPFVHREFVNDFVRVVRFFRPFSPTARHPRFADRSKQLINFENAKLRPLAPKAGSLLFRKHYQRRDELIKGQYVACIIIYLNQHLGKY